MYRHRLTLTLAWFLYMQEIQASKQNICTYFMIDSSPQGGADLVQHICMMLSDSQVMDAFRMSRALHSDPTGQASENTMQELATILKWEQGPAVGVGSGKAGLFYKLHALLHARRLVSSSWEATAQSFHSSISFTGDLGVESLFASITPFPLAALIPWSATESIDFDFQEDQAGTFAFTQCAESSAMAMAAPNQDAEPTQYHTGTSLSFRRLPVFAPMNLITIYF